MTTGRLLSTTFDSTWLSRWPRGMNTAPGIIPASNSSCSRTSMNVASLSLNRVSASAVEISWIRPLVSESSSRKLGITGSWKTFPAEVNATGRVGYSQDGSRLGFSDPLDQCRQQLTERGPAGGRREAVERRLLRVADDEPGAPGERDLGQPRGRVDAERRAQGDEQVRGLRGPMGPLEVGGHEVLAEADGGALQHPAALEADRVLLASLDPGQGLLHRAPPPALQALGRVHGAVDLDHLAGAGAGGEVEAVDVLGDERVDVRLLLELGDRPVPGVRLRLPDLAAQPVLPGELPDLGVVHVVLERRGLLGRRVLRPDAVRPPKVRDPRLGRDPRPGQDHDRVRAADPVRDRVE